MFITLTRTKNQQQKRNADGNVNIFFGLKLEYLFICYNNKEGRCICNLNFKRKGSLEYRNCAQQNKTVQVRAMRAKL